MKKRIFLFVLIIFIYVYSTSADNILIFSAHPDDETIGLGGKIIQSVKEGDAVKLVVMTDGAPDEYKYNKKYSEAQYNQIRVNETKAAMELAGIKNENIIFLDYDDSGYIFDLEAEGIVKAIYNVSGLIKEFEPDEIYVSAYEHGHIDHDTAHYIAVRALEKSSMQSAIFEYIEYNPIFWGKPIPEHKDMVDNKLYPLKYLNMSEEEIFLKKQMLTQYKSQNPNEDCRKKANLPNYAFVPDKIEKCSLDFGNWTECERDLLCFYYIGPDMIRRLPPYNYRKSPCVNDSCKWNDTGNWPNNDFYAIISEADSLLDKNHLNQSWKLYCNNFFQLIKNVFYRLNFVKY